MIKKLNVTINIRAKGEEKAIADLERSISKVVRINKDVLKVTKTLEL